MRSAAACILPACPIKTDMAYFADLHIHSCLSPCGDDEMTPGNIAGMALIKGLEVIAVCDHNTARNLPAVERCCAACGLVLLPGMEITTKEEVHMLGYFPAVEAALRASEELRAHLPKKKNKPAFFGRQLVMNEDDEVTCEEEALLIGATDLTLSQAAAFVQAFGGVAVPAHINRGANGLIVNLGLMPEKPQFSTLEIWRDLPVESAILAGKNVLHASDAHTLGDIRERDRAVLVPENTPEKLLAWMRMDKEK